MARYDLKTKEISSLILRNGEETLVDSEDYENLCRFVWSKHSAGYVVRSEGSSRKSTFKQYLLHRELLAAPESSYVDHINGDKMDNRKVNLRLCTNKDNTRNSSPHKDSSSVYKGVSWYSPTSNWTSRISADGFLYHLGRYPTELEAATAYDKKAKELFGEYAWLNFPDTEEAS